MPSRFGDDPVQDGAPEGNRFGDAPVEEKPGFFKRLYQGTVEPLVNMAQGAEQFGEDHPVLTALGGPGVPAAVTAFNIIKHTWQKSQERSQQAIDAIKEGEYGKAIAHLSAAFPLTMPGGEAGEKMAEDLKDKNYAGAGGTFTSVLAPAATKLLKGTRVPVAPKLVNPNPVEAAATSYLEGEGVPVSAAARTGNPYVAGVQKMADTTPLGAVVAQRAGKATTEALQATSERLAERAAPSPVVPEQAGAGVRTALEAKTARYKTAADEAYGQFRQAEADPANLKTVQQGTRRVDTGVVDAAGKPVLRSEPVTEQIPLATDLREIKAKLAPIVEDIDKWMQPAKREASAGYQAARSILGGPDFVPASVAEAGLGGLKQLAREGAGRNAGMAKFIVPKLQAEIDSAVGGANNPAALEVLQGGRAATAAQHGVDAVVDQLRAEPVQTFRQMVYSKDAGIDLLRQVAAKVPGELPKIGRAWLEDAFAKARETGGWDHAAKLLSDWENLGAQTKRMLFSQPLASDLNNFFLGAKKLAENPNPSGSGVVSWIAGQGALAVTHPHIGIPYMIGAGALSKLLHSSAGVRALTQGMKIPLRGPAAVATAGQILRMAGTDVKPVEFPKAAEAEAPEKQAPELAAAIGQ